MYYGQNKEDEIINNLIVSKYGENFKGSILDLGANDGVTLSNSRFFVERGWHGVLVEAGNKPFEKLFANCNAIIGTNVFTALEIICLVRSCLDLVSDS